MTDIASIIERVKKLLALSNSDNANEAAVATAKANALIDQYRISVEQIGESEDPLSTETEPLYETGRAMAWRKMLAVKLSRHYGCYVWNNPGHQSFSLRVAGRKSDVAVLRYMFAYISLECERIGVKECKGKGRRYAESYRQGFIDGVTSKLAESRKQSAPATADGQSALVKLDDRAREARQYVERAIRLTRGKTTATYRDGAAFANGQTAGSRLHLGQGLGAGRTRLLGNG